MRSKHGNTLFPSFVCCHGSLDSHHLKLYQNLPRGCSSLNDLLMLLLLFVVFCFVLFCVISFACVWNGKEGIMCSREVVGS